LVYRPVHPRGGCAQGRQDGKAENVFSELCTSQTQFSPHTLKGGPLPIKQCRSRRQVRQGRQKTMMIFRHFFELNSFIFLGELGVLVVKKVFVWLFLMFWVFKQHSSVFF
jgi:hypothetical protein